MRLTAQAQMTLCRTAAFIDGLRIIAAKEQDRDVEIGQISTEGVKALQAYTVDRANGYAERNFPGLSFPDETERELIPFVRGIDAEMSDESAELLGGTLAIRPGMLLGRC